MTPRPHNLVESRTTLDIPAPPRPSAAHLSSRPVADSPCRCVAIDGLDRRITENAGTATDIYSSATQDAEERQSGMATTQYVWSPVYVNALVKRDTFSGGTTTLYMAQDANYDVTSVIDTSGTAPEHVVYDAYGKPTFTDGSWTIQSGDTKTLKFAVQGGRFEVATALIHFGARDRDMITCQCVITLIILCILLPILCGCQEPHPARTWQGDLIETGAIHSDKDYATAVVVEQSKASTTARAPNVVPRPIMIVDALGKLPSAASRRYANTLMEVLAEAGASSAAGIRFDGGSTGITYSEMAQSDALTFQLLTWAGDRNSHGRTCFTPKLPVSAWRAMCMAIVTASPSDEALIWAMQNQNSPDERDFESPSIHGHRDMVATERAFFERAFGRLLDRGRPLNMTTLVALESLQNTHDTGLMLRYGLTFEPPSGHDVRDLQARVQKQLARARPGLCPVAIGTWAHLDDTIVAAYHADQVIRPFFEAVNRRDDEQAREFLAPALKAQAHDLFGKLVYGASREVEVEMINPSPAGGNAFMVRLRVWNTNGGTSPIEHIIEIHQFGENWRITRIRGFLQ